MPGKSLIALAAPLLLVACNAISEQERLLLTGDIDCDQADQRIASLNTARPTEARRARVLATSLTPAGFAIGVASNDFGDRERILSGEYDEDIDARIAAIRETCGLPTPAS